jgi:hypothetical protein
MIIWYIKYYNPQDRSPQAGYRSLEADHNEVKDHERELDDVLAVECAKKEERLSRDPWNGQKGGRASKPWDQGHGGQDGSGLPRAGTWMLVKKSRNKKRRSRLKVLADNFNVLRHPLLEKRTGEARSLRWGSAEAEGLACWRTGWVAVKEAQEVISELQGTRPTLEVVRRMSSTLTTTKIIYSVGW